MKIAGVIFRIVFLIFFGWLIITRVQALDAARNAGQSYLLIAIAVAGIILLVIPWRGPPT